MSSPKHDRVNSNNRDQHKPGPQQSQQQPKPGQQHGDAHKHQQNPDERGTGGAQRPSRR